MVCGGGWWVGWGMSLTSVGQSGSQWGLRILWTSSSSSSSKYSGDFNCEILIGVTQGLADTDKNLVE